MMNGYVCGWRWPGWKISYRISRCCFIVAVMCNLITLHMLSLIYDWTTRLARKFGLVFFSGRKISLVPACSSNRIAFWRGIYVLESALGSGWGEDFPLVDPYIGSEFWHAIDIAMAAFPSWRHILPIHVSVPMFRNTPWERHHFLSRDGLSRHKHLSWSTCGSI